jgi:hypothetical protein
VAVRVECDLDARVTEPFLNDIRVCPLGDRQPGGGVSEIVDPFQS